MTARDGWAIGIGSLLVVLLSVLAYYRQQWREQRRLARQALTPGRFEELARSIEIADPAVAAAWTYVVDAVKSVTHANDLLLALDTGQGAGYDEFGVEVEGNEVAVWSGLGETLRCPREGLVAALEALAARARATEEGPASGGDS